MADSTSNTKIPWYINGALVLALATLIVFPRKKEVLVYKDKVIVDTLTEYVYDTVTRVNYKTVFKYDSVLYHDTVVVKDTSWILRDYFASKEIVDTLSNDSILYARSIYNISQNRILDRTFEYKINRPQSVNMITVAPEQDPSNKRALWVGISTGGNRYQYSLRPSVAFEGRNDWMYGFSYDIVQRTSNFSLMYKLNWNKIWHRSKK